jgi:putative transposase
VTGCKRHLLVDTLGLILVLLVHSTACSDSRATRQVFTQTLCEVPTLRKVWADKSYRGTLITWVHQHCPWDLEIRGRIDDRPGFTPILQRWKVERTFGWLNRYRVLSKDYEYTPASSAAWVLVASMHVMLHRV